MKLTVKFIQVRVDTQQVRPTNYMTASTVWDDRVLKRMKARKAEAYSKASSQFKLFSFQIKDLTNN